MVVVVVVVVSLCVGGGGVNTAKKRTKICNTRAEMFLLIKLLV